MKKKTKIQFIILSLFIIYIFIFSDVGIISKIKLDQKTKLYEKKLSQLHKDNEFLKDQIKKLGNDCNYIAEMARKLGYAKKGEKIYRFYQNETIKSNLIKTNIKLSFQEKFKLKNYLVYFITFLIVLIIYIVLLRINKNH